MNLFNFEISHIGPNEYYTPEWLSEYMISLIDKEIPFSVFDPTPGPNSSILSAVRKVYPCNVSVEELKGDFWDIDISHVDIIVANPPFFPYSKVYQYLERFILIADQIICIIPWYTIINSERRTEKIIKSGLKRIVNVSRSAFPKIRVQICVLDIQKGYCGDAVFGNVGPNWKTEFSRSDLPLASF